MSALYYPYFRGRQYELIALRELVAANRLGDGCIIPIIEPVKLSSTLISTLQAFATADKRIGVVINPVYGNFLDEVAVSDDETQKKVYDLFAHPNLLRAYIQRRNIDIVVEKQIKFLKTSPDRSIAVYQNSEMLEASIAQQTEMGFRYGMNLVPDSISFRRKIRTGRILFHDCFNKKPRNSDYKDEVDELFSEDIGDCCYASPWYLLINPRRDVVEWALKNLDYKSQLKVQDGLGLVENRQAIPELKELILKALKGE